MKISVIYNFPKHQRAMSILYRAEDLHGEIPNHSRNVIKVSCCRELSKKKDLHFPNLKNIL